MNDLKWKRRLPGRIYDYNYKVSEGYYHPQTEFMEKRSYIPKCEAPPEAQTYAERFANNPWYGDTKGLPYAETEAAVYQPLANRRALSTSRINSIMRDRQIEGEDAPPYIRALRRRRRREGLEDDDYLGMLAFLDLDDNDKPIFDTKLKEDIKKLASDLSNSPRWNPKRGSTLTQEYATFDNDLKLPGKTKLTTSEESYTLPSTGTSVRKTSHAETSKYESSKPPTGMRTRRYSYHNNPDFDSKTLVHSSVKHSVVSMAGKPPIPSYHVSSDEGKSGFSRAKAMRDARRNKESEELTEHIHKAIQKMRSHDISNADIENYRQSENRTVRASSLGPYDIDNRAFARKKGRTYNFVYGVGKF